MSKSDAAIFQPELEADINQRSEFWSRVSPRSFFSAGENFIEDFRRLTHNILESDLPIAQLLLHEMTLDPQVLFFAAFFQFIKREFDTMPVYESGSVFRHQNQALAASYAVFYSGVSKASLNNNPAWNVIVSSCGAFLKDVYKAVGRIEMMPLRIKLRRHFFRDYDECATIEYDQMLHCLYSSKPLPVESQANQSPLSVCFFERDGRLIWDMSRIIDGPNVHLLSRTVAWAMATLPPTQFDRVVGIARSGLVFASIFALALRKPISIIDLDTSFNIDPAPSILERLLVIDDCTQSGYSLLFTNLMLRRKRIPAENIRFASVAKYDPRNSSHPDVVLPYIDGSDDWLKAIPNALSYSYGEVNGPTVLPRIDYDTTSCIPEWMIADTSVRIRQVVSSARRLQRSELSSRIGQLCTSGGFIKGNLLYDHPKTVLDIARHFFDIILEHNIDMIVAASAAATPVVAGMSLIAMYELSARDLTILIFPRDRTSILKLEEMPVERLSSARCAVIDVSFRSGRRYAYVESVLGKYGIIPKLTLSLIGAAYWSKLVKCDSETYSIYRVDES
jgi:hypothetical protein